MAPEVRARFEAEFDAEQRAEIGIGLALFHGFSKALIALGCEPEEMDTTVLRTPGSPPSPGESGRGEMDG
jgi:hypothetical protein